jgi:hypothetical protein
MFVWHYWVILELAYVFLVSSLLGLFLHPHLRCLEAGLTGIQIAKGAVHSENISGALLIFPD